MAGARGILNSIKLLASALPQRSCYCSHTVDPARILHVFCSTSPHLSACRCLAGSHPATDRDGHALRPTIRAASGARACARLLSLSHDSRAQLWSGPVSVLVPVPPRSRHRPPSEVRVSTRRAGTGLAASVNLRLLFSLFVLLRGAGSTGCPAPAPAALAPLPWRLLRRSVPSSRPWIGLRLASSSPFAYGSGSLISASFFYLFHMTRSANLLIFWSFLVLLGRVQCRRRGWLPLFICTVAASRPSNSWRQILQ